MNKTTTINFLIPRRNVRYADWAQHISWLVQYDRTYRGHSRWQQITTIIQSFVKHWSYAKKDRTILFDWKRCFIWRRSLPKQIEYTLDLEHEKWDLRLSQIACSRICARPVNGNCPHPFELNENHWTKERMLPIFSTYARRGWTPAFEQSEDIADALNIPREKHGYIFTRYRVNGGHVSGAIWHRIM